VGGGFVVSSLYFSALRETEECSGGKGGRNSKDSDPKKVQSLTTISNEGIHFHLGAEFKRSLRRYFTFSFPE